MPDERERWRGLDVDTAKAVAVAVFGGHKKVKFNALTAVQQLPALQSKEVDVLCRNITRSLTRETTNGLYFVHVNYYDGQGFLVPKKLNIRYAKAFERATVCVLPGTITDLNAAANCQHIDIFFKVTSLVVIIALFDLLKTGQTVLSNPQWMGFSRKLENALNTGY